MAKIANVQEVAVNKLKPYEQNAKIHGENQIEKLKASIEEFWFLTPCLIDQEYNLIAGHGRVMAAQELQMETVPCVFIEGECFILWICCNIGWMIIDIVHGTYSRAVLDVVQTAFAFYGYKTWSTAEKPKKESGDG